MVNYRSMLPVLGGWHGHAIRGTAMIRDSGVWLKVGSVLARAVQFFFIPTQPSQHARAEDSVGMPPVVREQSSQSHNEPDAPARVSSFHASEGWINEPGAPTRPTTASSSQFPSRPRNPVHGHIEQVGADGVGEPLVVFLDSLAEPLTKLRRVE